MKTKISREFHRQLELIFQSDAERFWSIGALHDGLKFRGQKRVSLWALDRAVHRFAVEGKLTISWQVPGIQRYRLSHV